MNNPRLIVAGIGPGSANDITPAVLQAIKDSDVFIGNGKGREPNRRLNRRKREKQYV